MLTKLVEVTPTEMKRALFLDIVVRQRPPILQLLACKNKALLVRWDTFLVLNLGFHVIDGVRRLHLQRDSFAGQRLHKNLHATPETKDQM